MLNFEAILARLQMDMILAAWWFLFLGCCVVVGAVVLYIKWAIWDRL